MKKTVWVMILAMIIITLTGCNLFFDPKLVSYSVKSASPVSVDIVAADGDGAIFTRSTQTDWSSSEFEVKYSDFPFLAHIVVTNNDGINDVIMAVYLEGTVDTSKTVAAGDTDVITTSVYY